MNPKRHAFTLIELLVVIAVIAVLMAILMPSLNRAREAGKRIACLNNLKSLAMVWHMYADSNDGQVPSGGYKREKLLGQSRLLSVVQRPESNPEHQELAIKRGLLYPYCGNNIEVYRCPTGKRGEMRTYSMPDSFGGVAGVSRSSLTIRRRSDLKRPAEQMLFLDEGFCTYSTWTIFYNQSQWWDPVPIRHGIGTTLAFGDGHSEYWKWRDQRTIDFGLEAAATDNPDTVASFWRPIQPDNEDIEKLVRAVWGMWGGEMQDLCCILIEGCHEIGVQKCYAQGLATALEVRKGGS